MWQLGSSTSVCVWIWDRRIWAHSGVRCLVWICFVIGFKSSLEGWVFSVPVFIYVLIPYEPCGAFEFMRWNFFIFVGEVISETTQSLVINGQMIEVLSRYKSEYFIWSVDYCSLHIHK